MLFLLNLNYKFLYFLFLELIVIKNIHLIKKLY